MAFTLTIDPCQRRRSPPPHAVGRKRRVQAAMVDLSSYHHARALPLPGGMNPCLSGPSAVGWGIATQQEEHSSKGRGVSEKKSSPAGGVGNRGMYLPPRHAGDLSLRGDADVNLATVSVPIAAEVSDVPAGTVAEIATALGGRGQHQWQDGAEEKGWKDGLLGYGARVLALSVASGRRELLCDRKDPYAHLTPRRLAITVAKSAVVVAAPMVNEVILENLDEDDHEGRGGRGSGGSAGFEGRFNRVYVGDDGELVIEREGREEKDAGSEGDDDPMKSLSKSFQPFPALMFRRVLHNVMTVSTQRILEWQAVMQLPTRTADRLTKNIALSALRKTERMSRCMAAVKMSITAGKALFFQNLSLFIVDQLFLGVSVGLRERRRLKDNPYACTDWPAVLRELRRKSVGNAAFAFCIWVAGTIGSVAGTMVYPPRGPELLSILAEMGASALLN